MLYHYVTFSLSRIGFKARLERGGEVGRVERYLAVVAVQIFLIPNCSRSMRVMLHLHANLTHSQLVFEALMLRALWNFVKRPIEERSNKI